MPNSKEVKVRDRHNRHWRVEQGGNMAVAAPGFPGTVLVIDHEDSNTLLLGENMVLTVAQIIQEQRDRHDREGNE